MPCSLISRFAGLTEGLSVHAIFLATPLLTLAATNRARQISAGSQPLLDADRDKPTVIALREIAAGKVGIEMLLKP